MEWKEEDHERDDQGRFASKGEPPKIKIEDGISLSKSQWGMWYKMLADAKRGDRFPSANGATYFTVENKIVITRGIFENPTIESVLTFRTIQEADEYRKRIFGRK